MERAPDGAVANVQRGSDAVSMVLSKKPFTADKDLNKFEGSFDAGRLKGRTILNPLYMKVGSAYKLKFPSDFYEEEYYLIKDYFPGSISTDSKESDLRKKFVLIPVPDEFTRKNERLYRFKLWR